MPWPVIGMRRGRVRVSTPPPPPRAMSPIPRPPNEQRESSGHRPSGESGGRAGSSGGKRGQTGGGAGTTPDFIDAESQAIRAILPTRAAVSQDCRNLNPAIRRFRGDYMGAGRTDWRLRPHRHDGSHVGKPWTMAKVDPPTHMRARPIPAQKTAPRPAVDCHAI